MSEILLNSKLKNPINIALSKTKINGTNKNIMPSLNTSSIQVQKRDGKKELLDINKIHFVVEEACDGLAGVSASLIEMNANIQFYDGITTKDIQNVLVRSANDLITLENPNYQFAAARLLSYDVRKEAHGQYEYMPLLKLILRNVRLGVYDKGIVDKYSKTEIKKCNTWIKRDRDLKFTYAGLRQVVDKYLVQDRSTGQLYETPQDMYMMIAATLFADYPEKTRLNYVRRYYDAISQHKINIPTPVMSGVRTPIRQFASCVLVDSDDTLSSIFSSDMAIGLYVARRAGIGINAGRIRGINSKIRGGEVQHTGVIPFLKKFESTVRCCTQNGVRGGNATVHFPIWHTEIEDILVLKNNKGTEDNRVRRMDYSIQISKLFYPKADIDHPDQNLVDAKKIKKKYPTVFFGKNVLIGKNVIIGKKSFIGSNTIIESNVEIGLRCFIGSFVIIKNSIISNDVLIQDGSKVGIKGFGFIPSQKKNIRSPHVGKVLLHDGVELGANCTIDRGSLSDTIIGENTFLDNQVHLAHNVKIGKNCMIAGQVGFAGSSILGDNVIIGGQAGISGHLKIGNNVQIGGGSGVIKDISDNSKVMGYPSKDLRQFLKDNK